MQLREILDLCQDKHSDDWVEVPGSRPATAMVAGLFDAGMKEAQTRPLDGHTLAVYEPNACISLVWPVPDEPEAERDGQLERGIPEWAENDTDEWKHARLSFAVILFNGSPVWQEPVWYLDWGSGIGGYVPYIEAVFSGDREDGVPQIDRWQATEWGAGLARLINAFSPTSEWATHDPTSRIVPNLSKVHPLDGIEG